MVCTALSAASGDTGTYLGQILAGGMDLDARGNLRNREVREVVHLARNRRNGNSYDCCVNSVTARRITVAKRSNVTSACPSSSSCSTTSATQRDITRATVIHHLTLVNIKKLRMQMTEATCLSNLAVHPSEHWRADSTAGTAPQIRVLKSSTGSRAHPRWPSRR
jgi:hypothetical protein